MQNNIIKLKILTISFFIFLGFFGLAHSAQASLPASDDFNRADADPIGGNWTTVPGSGGNMRIVSNQAAVAVDNDSAAYWNADTFANDQWSQVTMSTVVANNVAGPAVRASSSAYTMYFLGTYYGNYRLFKVVAGSYTTLATYSVIPANGDVVKLSVAGTTLVSYINGVAQATVTDSDIVSGSAAIYANNTGFRMDDWSGGNINNVYYSVGQNASNHCGPAGDGNDCGNVSIASGIATFTAAQAGTNLGVGDRLTYDGHIAYLATKTDTTHWSVVDEHGIAAANHASTAVTSIAHEFTTLSSAITLSVNSSHINNTDLTAANVVLNLPCYYDTGADTTAVTVDGYTTGANNYIKIYTPNNTSTEANTSQRHSGKWDEGKYRIQSNADAVLSIANASIDIEIDGLQINNTGTGTAEDNWGFNLSSTGSGTVSLNNNIIKGELPTGARSGGIYTAGTATAMIGYFFNNLIYDTNGNAVADSTSAAFRLRRAGWTSYVYNNTLIHTNYGMVRESTAVIAKNNLIYDCVAAAGGTFGAGTGYNATNNVAMGYTVTGDPDPVVGDRLSQTFTFANEVADDFHLSLADTGARDYGTSLANDSNLRFSDDIDGEERPGTWDIGADEQPGTVYHATEPRVEGLASGLVLYQSFDGAHMDWSASSAEARDQSGQNNNGDVDGATATTGKIGQALGFDGSSNAINLGSPDSLDDISPASYSFWMYPEADTGDYGGIMDKGSWVINRQDANNSLEYYRNCSGSNMEVHTPADSIKLNQWQHITITWDGACSYSGVKIYIDDVLQSVTGADATAPPVSDSSFNLQIGVNTIPETDSYYKGKLDEVRVYDRALSVDEVGDLYRMGQVKINKSWTDSLKTGLVGMWSFDGPDIDWSTNTAYDRSGSIPANDGAISGATAAIGKRGQGLSFSNDDYINAGTGSSLDNLGPMTISAWIYPRTYGEDALGIIIEKNASNPGSWWLTFYLDQGGINFNKDFSGTNDLNVITSDNSYNFNQWNYITATWDGSGTASNVHIYINGVEASYVVQQNGDESAVSDTGSGVYIGGHATAYNLDSKLDEVRVYNRALSEMEIGDLYRMGQVMIKK